MSHTKTARDIFASLVVLLCLASGARAQESPPAPPEEAAESARRLAAAADDRAPGLEERQDALRKLEEAARLFAGAGEKSEAARALNRAGRLQLSLHAPREALASHQRALSLLEGTADAETEVVDGLNGLAAAQVLLQKKTGAEAALRRSLSLSARAGYTRGRAQALLTLSDLQNYDDHVAALKTARESLALWEEAGDREGLARAHAQAARCLNAQYALAESTEHYRAALRIWRELNNREEQVETLLMLGIVEFRKGNREDCISLVTEAQGMLDERAEPANAGRVSAILGDAFNEHGLPEIGLPHFERALELYRRSQDEYLIRYATLGIGCTHYLLRNYPEALARFRPLLEGVPADSLAAAPLHDYIGRVQVETGELDEALRNFRTALAIYTRAGNKMEAARARAFLGRVYERQGQAASARRSYREALDAFDKLSERHNQSAVLYALGRLELAGGDLRAAETFLGRSIEVTENIRRVPLSSDLTTTFSASVYERYEAYVECLMRRHEAEPSEGFDERAFEASELARARSLAELLRATETNLTPGLDPQLAAREKALRQALRAKENYRVQLLSRKTYRKEDLDALEAELARLEEEYRQVNESIRAAHPTYEQLARPVAWDLRRVREEVVADEQTVLLEYHLGEEKGYVWAVTRDRLTSHELPPRAAVNEAARRVYEALAAPPGARNENELNEAARELSRMVLSPVAERANVERVLVAADGALNYVPFQLLPSPTADGEPLVARSEVVNVPSASVLGQLREETARRRASWKTLAAFGDPVFAADYAQSKGEGGEVASTRTPEGGRGAVRDIKPEGDSFDPANAVHLLYAARELANLREVASGGETFIASEYEATRERLRSTDLEGFAILHFATHGYLDPARPEKSGLVLSTVDREGRPLEGFVGLQDVYNLRAPVDLVVLSACRTALGKEVRGEGLVGLTRGFMYAGASSVVASLWKVDDEATAELMKRFYANVLKSGMTPAAALRDAQNSIRREPQWRSPRYWAAFTLQGEYRRVIAPAAAAGVSTFDGKTLAAGGALLAACAGAAWLFLRRRRRARADG